MGPTACQWSPTLLNSEAHNFHTLSSPRCLPTIQSTSGSASLCWCSGARGSCTGYEYFSYGALHARDRETAGATSDEKTCMSSISTELQLLGQAVTPREPQTQGMVFGRARLWIVPPCPQVSVPEPMLPDLPPSPTLLKTRRVSQGKTGAACSLQASLRAARGLQYAVAPRESCDRHR